MKVSTLKRKLDGIFSEYVRRKHADRGYVNCCSCGKRMRWQDVHAGHFVSRRHNSLRYDERNVHPQCAFCNSFREGNPAGYAKYLVDMYGKEILDELAKEQRKHKKFTPKELEELIKVYKQKLKELDE
jgi:hypothetical protein